MSHSPRLLAIYGSPRRRGNSSSLLGAAVKGACEAGATVDEIVLRDLRMSPCMEIYGCKKTGRCAIQDDFQQLYDLLLAADGLLLATPIFFYSVSAQVKIFIDRCQSLWVKKNWLESDTAKNARPLGKALLIAVGATRGQRLFDGTLLTMKYFLEVLDMELAKSLLYRGLDFEEDIKAHPEYLDEAFHAGRDLAASLRVHDGRGGREV